MAGRVISFNTPEPLPALLGGDLERLSLLEDTHGDCAQVSLWYRDGHGISIWSEMQDVAERLEVGVLSLRRVDEEAKESSIAFPRPGTPRKVAITPPMPVSEVWKMRITEAGIICESGLHFLFADSTQLTILSSSRPYFLAIFIGNTLSTSSVPEYDVADYERERVL